MVLYCKNCKYIASLGPWLHHDWLLHLCFQSYLLFASIEKSAIIIHGRMFEFNSISEHFLLLLVVSFSTIYMQLKLNKNITFPLEITLFFWWDAESLYSTKNCTEVLLKTLFLHLVVSNAFGLWLHETKIHYVFWIGACVFLICNRYWPSSTRLCQDKLISSVEETSSTTPDFLPDNKIAGCPGQEET